MATTKPMTIYGFSDVDISKQIIVAEVVFAGISRAGQAISIYRGETLIADCTMPSTGIADIPTVVVGELTMHDETFTGFVEGETYTIVAGDEPPITGFGLNGGLYSFDPSAMWYIFSSRDKVFAEDGSATRTNYTISQKITTTKKRYDIKRLPEELLPKTVATKAEVRKAQSTAETAQSTAETAQSTAETAQSTAETAQSTAETAKGFRCYLSRDTSTRTFEFDGTTTGRDTFRYNAFGYYKISDFAPTVEQVVSFSGTRSNGIIWSDVTNGRNCRQYGMFIVVDSAGYATLGSQTFFAPSRGLYAMFEEGNASMTAGTATFTFYAVEAACVYDSTVFVSGDAEIILNSSTPNSTKQFKITVDDSGTISATEVVG